MRPVKLLIHPVRLLMRPVTLLIGSTGLPSGPAPLRGRPARRAPVAGGAMLESLRPASRPAGLRTEHVPWQTTFASVPA
jgi:hypothetical protein